MLFYCTNYPERPGNLKKNTDKKYPPSLIYVKNVLNDNCAECDVSSIYASQTINHMILDIGWPLKVAGKVWGDCFVDSLNID